MDQLSFVEKFVRFCSFQKFCVAAETDDSLLMWESWWLLSTDDIECLLK